MHVPLHEEVVDLKLRHAIVHPSKVLSMELNKPSMKHCLELHLTSRLQLLKQFLFSLLLRLLVGGLLVLSVALCI